MVVQSDKEGNVIRAFIGKADEGLTKGDRYGRILKWDEEGNVIKDHWERKGRASWDSCWFLIQKLLLFSHGWHGFEFSLCKNWYGSSSGSISRRHYPGNYAFDKDRQKKK